MSLPPESPRLRTALPILLFSALVVLLATSWYFVQHRERTTLDQNLEVSARRSASLLERFLGGHMERVDLLAVQLSLEEEVTEEVFRAVSSDYQSRFAGLQALNWVDSAGVIRWVEPLETNEGALGYDLTRHPVASVALARARESENVAATPPTELLQGGWGLAAYRRVSRGSEDLGYLNVVFRLPDLMRECLGESSDGFAYILHYGEDRLGSLGPMLTEKDEIAASSASFSVGDQQLTMTVIASPRSAPASSTWVDELLALAGVLLAAGLAWSVHVAGRRRMDATLMARKYRTLLDHAPDAILAVDASTGLVVESNERCLELFGLAPAELERLRPSDLGPERQLDGRDSAEAFGEYLRRASEGGSCEFEWQFRRSDSRELFAHVHLVGLPDPHRKLVRASVTDVSKRRELELKLRQARAHEAMGRLAGAVAHDFNNLLTAMFGSAELIKETSGANQRVGDLSAQIMGCCDRASGLTRQLLAFSRRSNVVAQPVELSSTVSGLAPILERLVGERVRIELALGARSWIRVDPQQFELVVLNLVVNARDAMPSGGTIHISTRDRRDSLVELCVRDEGMGLSEDVLPQVFEPFFTTKAPGVGTGIGLATVREIVEREGGEVTVESRAGEGAEFRVLLPAHVVPDSVPAPVPASGSSSPVGAPRRILLVEDDEAVRAVLTSALRDAGHDVREVASGEEALSVQRNGDPFDVLVTDLVLPGMGGVELEATIRETVPDLLSVLMTGYSEDDLDSQAPGLVGRRLLRSKPFSPQELLADIEALAGAERRT